MNRTFLCFSCKTEKDRSEFYERTTVSPTRPVTYCCKKCRSEEDRTQEYWNRAYQNASGKVCDRCEWPKKNLIEFNQEKLCKQCLKNTGWKKCDICETIKVLIDFYDRQSSCIDCVKEKNDWRALPDLQSDEAFNMILKDLEQHRNETDKEKKINQLKERAREAKRARAKRLKNVDRKDAYLKRKFGISYLDYLQIFDDQKGVCAICKRPPNKKRLHVDHDHITGKVRGLLCYRCNVGLGLFKDSVDALEEAVVYLRRAETSPDDRSSIPKPSGPEPEPSDNQSGTASSE